MSDTQAICSAVVAIGFMAFMAFLIWISLRS